MSRAAAFLAAMKPMSLGESPIDFQQQQLPGIHRAGIGALQSRLQPLVLSDGKIAALLRLIDERA